MISLVRTITTFLFIKCCRCSKSSQVKRGFFFKVALLLHNSAMIANYRHHCFEQKLISWLLTVSRFAVQLWKATGLFFFCCLMKGDFLKLFISICCLIVMMRVQLSLFIYPPNFILNEICNFFPFVNLELLY